MSAAESHARPAAEQRSQRDGAAADAALAARIRTIEIETARLKLQVAQLAHLVAIRDAHAAGVTPDDILAELGKIGAQGAEILAGGGLGAVQ